MNDIQESVDTVGIVVPHFNEVNWNIGCNANGVLNVYIL